MAQEEIFKKKDSYRTVLAGPHSQKSTFRMPTYTTHCGSFHNFKWSPVLMRGSSWLIPSRLCTSSLEEIELIVVIGKGHLGSSFLDQRTSGYDWKVLFLARSLLLLTSNRDECQLYLNITWWYCILADVTLVTPSSQFSTSVTSSYSGEFQRRSSRTAQIWAPVADRLFVSQRLWIFSRLDE